MANLPQGWKAGPQGCRSSKYLPEGWKTSNGR